MKKRILYILLLLPALFLFEKGFCQFPKYGDKYLVCEKTKNINGKSKIRTKTFHEHQRVKIFLKDGTKIRGPIKQISDSSISIRKVNHNKITDVKINDINKIHTTSAHLVVIGSVLTITNGVFLAYTIINNDPTFSILAFVLLFDSSVLDSFGIFDEVTKTRCSSEKGWKVYATTQPPKFNLFYYNK
jgi:hypothetical protein